MDVARAVFEEGWNGRDFESVLPLLARPFPFHVGGATRLTDAAQFEIIVTSWHQAFPDFRFEVHSITADDRMAAVRATLHGTHQGPWGTLPPTGRAIAVEHAFFLAVDDGVVTEVWEILDRSELVAQLTGDELD